MSETVNVNKNNNMGVLHMLGAIFVMLGHQCALLGIPVPVIMGSPIHAIGVKVIFLISGYLITKSIWKINEINIGGGRVKTSRIYFMKRISRIYPEYIVCLLVSILIIGPLCTALSFIEYFNSWHIWIGYFFNNIRLYISYGLPEVFMSNPYPGAVNGSLWTIPVEIVLYVVLWLIVVIPNNNRKRKLLYLVVSIILLCGLLIRTQFYQYASVVFYGTDWLSGLDNMPYFMIGGLFYLYDLKKYINIQQSSVLMFVFCSIAFDSRLLSELIRIVVLSIFVMSISTAETQRLKTKFIDCECSYGMYLYGFPVQQILISKLYVEKQIHLNWLFLFVLSVICTYLLAVLSNRLVYRPFKRFIAK